MKVYISVDMEGISGISTRKFLTPKEEEYQRGRKFLINDVNAAIEGALEAGATEVVINDAHGTMQNILIEDLNKNAKLVSGYPKPNSMMCGIDSTFDAAIFIGYHAKNDSEGLLCHTISGNLFRNIKINNVSYGEYGINAAIAGYFDVPVVFVSGDDYLEKEVKKINSDVSFVVTKTVITQVCAKLKNPEIVGEKIKQQVKETLINKKNIKTLKLESKLKVDVELKSPIQIDIVENIPTVKRTSPTSCTFEAENMIEVGKILITMFNSSSVMNIGFY